MTATYRDVKADILEKITLGIWAPGSFIPKETELAETYDCARATVSRAMRELADDGLIERKRKAGTRVRMAPVRQARFEIPIVRHEIEKKGGEYRYALVRKEQIRAPDWLRARLKLNDGCPIIHLACMHYSDGVPYQFEDRWINIDLLPSAAQMSFSEVGPNEWLIATIPFSTVEIGFMATEADEELVAHLNCLKGDALFQSERSTWWEGKAITFVRQTYRRGHRMTTRY